MKKTLTINLSGVVYHIDEDAYSLLDKYLKDIKSHLQQSDEAQEVMGDIENRISELFSEKIAQGFQVITIQDVETVINRMGSPESYRDAAEGETDPKTDSKTKQKQSREKKSREESGQKTKKRIYRNPDDKMLGGVASGIAAYIDSDPVWVRLAFVFLTLFWGVTIPLYLLCWIVIPPATTAAEKLEMRGEEINLENIGKTVTETFNNVAGDVSDFVKSKRTRNAAEKLGDFITNVVSFCIKFIMLIVGFSAAFLLFGLVVGLVAVLAVYLFGKTYSWEYIFDYPIAYSPELVLLLIVSGVLVLGIPLFSLFHAALRENMKWRPMSSFLKWSLFAVWFGAVFLSIYFGIYVGRFY